MLICYLLKVQWKQEDKSFFFLVCVGPAKIRLILLYSENYYCSYECKYMNYFVCSI